MADSVPNITGYENYHKATADWFQLEPQEANDVEEIMKQQQPKLSCSFDTINNKIVKTSCQQLVVPMSIIVNKSISEGPQSPLYTS